MSTLDRLPASMPLVSLSPIVEGNDVIAIGGEQFEDGRRRLVVSFRMEIDALLLSARNGGLMVVRHENGWWIATVPDDEEGQVER